MRWRKNYPQTSTMRCRFARTELLKDELTARRVEVAVVTFGGSVRVVQDFAAPSELRSCPISLAERPAAFYADSSCMATFSLPGSGWNPQWTT